MIYDNIIKNDDIVRKDKSIRVVNHFNDGAYIEIISSMNQKFRVEFIDSNGKLEYKTTLNSNSWSKTLKKYFERYTCKVYIDDTIIHTHVYDATDKNVYIILDSRSLGDTIAWIPYAEEFRKKWNCNVILSTFLNHLFEDVYPEITFVQPGTVVSDVYATYRIGLFIDNNNYDLNKNVKKPNELPLQQIASDILGLNYEEVKPKIKKFNPHISEKPYICLGIHSTAQAKYWNNPTGWQELMDYIKSNGYDIYLLSKEEDGYMGNILPDGVTHIQNKTLEEIAEYLVGSEGFVGVSSGLSWYSWALNTPTILISGFTDEDLEMKTDVVRIINKDVCNGCWAKHMFDTGDWNWCPEHKGTERQFECTKSITFDIVKPHIEKLLKS